MSDNHELLEKILAEVRAERDADTAAALEYTDEFRDIWVKEVRAPLARNWYTAVKTFYSKGLSRVELRDAVLVTGASTAPSTGKFKYFCGVANTKLRQISDAALERFESEGDAK